MRPLLFVDVDGVLNPFAAGVCPVGFVEYHLFPGEEAVRLSPLHAERLHELADVFELVWATSWNVDERALLSALVSLPDFGGAISLPGGRARSARRRGPAALGRGQLLVS